MPLKNWWSIHARCSKSSLKHSIRPGDNSPRGTNYTATCLPSRKLYKLDEPDTQDTAGEARTNSSVMYSYGPPHMAKQKQDDQHEHTYSSYVRIRDVALKTCQKRWMIGRSVERGSGISELATRHDDDVLHIVLLKCPHVQITFLKFTSCDNQGLVGCIPNPAVAVHLNLKS